MLVNNKKILLASKNEKKRKELQEILQGMGIELLNFSDLEEEMPDVVEDGKSFTENAIKKAKTIAKLSNYTTLADDSGLVVRALGGEPGIYSARFAGENASDEANNNKLLNKMKDIAWEDRDAYFICVIALCTPEGEVRTVEGRCEGRITFTPQGEGGFGYDPLFMPHTYNKSFAQLNSEEKHLISHRGKALRKIKDIIE